MAHVKAGGTAKGNKDSVSKRLGVKVFVGKWPKLAALLFVKKGQKYIQVQE